MLNNANFLFEIATEEIPAGYISPALESIKKMFTQKLKEARLEYNEIEIYATPRRIAVFISSLSDLQRKDILEVKGPSVKAAYDSDGNPTKALQGFLRGNDLNLDNTYIEKTEKGEYVYAKKQLSSNKTEDIMPEILEEIILNLPFPKKMKWGNKHLTFPRPIRSFVLMFNNKVIPFSIEGISSSNKTRGHFVQFNDMFEIKDIGNYESLLESKGVILDQHKRKKIIADELEKVAKSVNGILNRDDELLETVTYIVENPYVVVCQFDEDFLKIPEIVLIAEMREHQKYFAVMDSSGKLTNYFLVVANNPVTENIVKGNVKVISARFKDAGFFYKEDKKLSLFDRVDSLKSVLFHKDLGSIYDKIDRMQKIGAVLSQKLNLDQQTSTLIGRSILLCKTDLNTEMVNEFSSLQGKIGKIYAQNDGEDSAVANAIDEHYKPRFHGDKYPSEIISTVVSIAEKVDNIFGSFSVGNIPKGSQDPYALRRQANAIVEMLLRNELNIDLKQLLVEVSKNYKDGKNLISKILDFISARVKTVFAERGFSYDEIDACLSIDFYDYLELFRRAKSINEFRKNQKFTDMLLSFKRMNNILAGFYKKNKGYELSFNEDLLSEKEEKDLFEFFKSQESEINLYIKESKYIELFNLLIKGKDLIDSFFDAVLVMDENVKVRDSRLFLLQDILNNFSSLMDFSKISDK